MMKKIFGLFLLIHLMSPAQNIGDTVVIKTFKYGSTTRDTAIQFPSGSTTYEKIIMRYNMRCKNGLVSTSSQRNLGCGEWDYSCNTFIADSSRIEEQTLTHPNYIISNFTGSTFYYTNFPLYDYYLYSQQNVTLNSILTETQFTIGLGTNTVSNLLNANEKSGKTQLLYTASELLSAGFTAGNIDGISLEVTNTGGTANFFNIGIQHISQNALSSASLTLSGFTNVFNQNFTFVNGSNRIQFHTPFIWNGSDNILIEYSYTNSTPNSSIHFNGTNTASVNALYSNNNYAIDFSSEGQVDIVTTFFSSLNSQMTLSFWAFGDPNLLPANTSLIYGYNNDSLQRSLNIHLPWSNSNIYFDCGYSNGSYDRINKLATANQIKGQWNHWVFTKNLANARMSIYLNGNLWTIGNGKSKTISILKMILGKDASQLNNYKGKINELSIWDKELVAADIPLIQNRSITASHPYYSNLLAYYRMMEGTGQIINDMKNAVTSNGKNLIWTFDRGDKLNRMFNESTSKPNITLLRGTYSISTSTVTIKDSLPRNPVTVREYSITSNATVTPMANDLVNLVSTSSNYYNASAINVYDGNTGTLTSTIAATPTGTLNIVNLNYIKRHPYYIELLSFVTPYGIGLDLGMKGKTWYFDMSDYAPLLKNRKRFLLTMGGQNQEEMDIDFLFIVGTPPRNVIDCYQLWQGGARLGSSSIGSINADTRFNTQTVTINATAQDFKMRSTITGHGSEGEFHQNGGLINHYFNINGGPNEFNWQITRKCAGNPVYPQGGTWIYDRQGWCPGEFSLLKEYYITPYVTPGSTVTLDYNTSTPPVTTGDYRYIAAHQLISYGPANHSLDASILDVNKPSNKVQYSRENPMCANPIITVQNTGSTALTSLTIEYWINNSAAKETFTWTGNLSYMDTTNILLPIGNLWGNGFNPSNNMFHVELVKANGSTDNYQFNNKYHSDFTLPDVITDSVTVEIKTNNTLENSYKIVDINNTLVPGASSLSIPNTVYSDSYILNGCYKLIVEDTGEDGISWWANTAQGTGYIKLKDAQGNVIKTFEPDFGKGFEYSFSTKPFAYVGVKEKELDRSLRLFPNPAHQTVYLKMNSTKGVTINLIDMTGRTIEIPFTIINDQFTFDTQALEAGVYMLQINQGESSTTKKLVIY